MIDWNIQTRAHVCALTGRTFADQESYYTVLLDHRHGFERLDLCAEAWRKHGAEVLARPGLISHWRGTYETPPAVAPEAIPKDDAESLLRKLVERGEERFAAACYILAVMLERKRILKVKAQIREGERRVFVYEQPRTGDVFTITDPDLQLSQLEDVQRQVGDLLEHGLEGSDGNVPAGDALVANEPIEEPFNPPSDLATLAPAVA